MRTIVIDHFLLESLESIGETSLDDVEIDPRIEDICNVAACSNAAASCTHLDALWKTIESSLGRVDITRRVEARVGKNCRCECVVRIDSESSQFSMLRVVPQTQLLVSHSDIERNQAIARVECLRSLEFSQRALPFTAPAIDIRATLLSQSIVRLQLERPVEFRKRYLVLAITKIKP